MARIAGVDLPRQKHINIALTYIYGIGHPRAGRILDEAKVEPMKKVQDLSEEEVNRIRTVIEEQGLVEGDLRKEVSDSAPTPTPAPAKVRAKERSHKRRRRRQKRKSSC
jgi:ribosomal protein uS13